MARFGRTGDQIEDDVHAAGGQDQPGTSIAPAGPAEVDSYSPEVIARVRELVADIPEADAGGAEAIVEQLIAATTIDDLNAPWDGTSGRKMAGKTLVVQGIHARPSQYEGGAGIFLVALAVDAKTGEKATFTTSALAVVLQLAQAYRLGMFPVTVEIVVAERPTARGFYPYHLRIVGAGNRGVRNA